jgi:hypothetical protein
MKVTRRSFIAAGAVGAAGLALPSAADAFQNVPGIAAVPKKPRKLRSHVIYRLSVRGRRASNMAKAYCANLRFKTKKAARTHPRPHRGINARIVPLDVSTNEFHRLFVARHASVADLRELRGFIVVGA